MAPMVTKKPGECYARARRNRTSYPKATPLSAARTVARAVRMSKGCIGQFLVWVRVNQNEIALAGVSRSKAPITASTKAVGSGDWSLTLNAVDNARAAAAASATLAA